jgi:hypothetical protein
MTRKDYIVIAQAISAARHENQSASARDALDSVVLNLLPALRADNPAFNAGKFAEACMA